MLGVTGPATLAFGYVLPPDDVYYTLIRASDCPVCFTPPAFGLIANSAHVWLYFTEPCEIPITVTLVPADLTDPSCPRPVTSFDACYPVQYVVNDGGTIGQCLDVQLPLSPFCGVTGSAFLKVVFGQGSCGASRPAFCSPANCTDCSQYNIYPGSPPGGDDLCQVLGPLGIHGAIMYTDIDCLYGDPVRPANWGRLKTLYR